MESIEDFSRSMEYEIKIMQKIRKQSQKEGYFYNIIFVNELLEDDDNFWLVMDYVDGKSLEDEITTS